MNDAKHTHKNMAASGNQSSQPSGMRDCSYKSIQDDNINDDMLL